MIGLQFQKLIEVTAERGPAPCLRSLSFIMMQLCARVSLTGIPCLKPPYKVSTTPVQKLLDSTCLGKIRFISFHSFFFHVIPVFENIRKPLYTLINMATGGHDESGNAKVSPNGLQLASELAFCLAPGFGAGEGQ